MSTSACVSHALNTSHVGYHNCCLVLLDHWFPERERHVIMFVLKCVVGGAIVLRLQTRVFQEPHENEILQSLGAQISTKSLKGKIGHPLKKGK